MVENENPLLRFSAAVREIATLIGDVDWGEAFVRTTIREAGFDKNRGLDPSEWIQTEAIWFESKAQRLEKDSWDGDR